MAALSSIAHLNHNYKQIGLRSYSKAFITVSCQNRDHKDPFDEKTEKGNKKNDRPLSQQIFIGVEKLGKELKDSCSPKQEGDWKDITLMCLSFAVYVYMSQKIVCAYCVWMSMVN